MASFEAETYEKKEASSEEMTFSKSCQIELFTMPTRLKYLALDKPGPKPLTPVQLMPCAYKAKHSVIMRTDEFGSRQSMKFRLCEFHFNYLYQFWEGEAEKRESSIREYDIIPFCRFRRNRL